MEAGVRKELFDVEWVVNLTDPDFFHNQQFSN